jgi:hypothetical protein
LHDAYTGKSYGSDENVTVPEPCPVIVSPDPADVAVNASPLIVPEMSPEIFKVVAKAPIGQINNSIRMHANLVIFIPSPFIAAIVPNTENEPPVPLMIGNCFWRTWGMGSDRGVKRSSVGMMFSFFMIISFFNNL